MSTLAGTKWVFHITSWGAEITMEFAPKGSGVTIQVTGAAKSVSGIYAENGDGTFIIQSPSGYGWWNSIYSGTHQDATGTGQYAGYEGSIGLAYLKSFTMTKVS